MSIDDVEALTTEWSAPLAVMLVRPPILLMLLVSTTLELEAMVMPPEFEPMKCTPIGLSAFSESVVIVVYSCESE